MTKEQIKYAMENKDTILNEIMLSMGSRVEELDQSSISAAVMSLYELSNRYCKEIIEKYNLDAETLRLYFALDKTLGFEEREEILGPNKNQQLIKQIIDIYGEEAQSILGCDSEIFEMSHIESILSGDRSQKYKEFYINVLRKKCEQVQTLEKLSDIILSTKPEYVTPELVTLFLKTGNRQITVEEIQNFVQQVPAISINGKAIKGLIENVQIIDEGQKLVDLLEMIDTEILDQEFVMGILGKINEASDISIKKFLDFIPQDIRTREMYELAISKGKNAIFALPETTIFENMSDEEYIQWCEGQILSTIDENTDTRQLLRILADYQKTENICEILVGKTKDLGVEDLNFIPVDKRNRKIFEIFLEKTDGIICEIPYENFDKNISQEEYDKWVEKIIINKINSKEISLDKNRGTVLSTPRNIPRDRITPNVFFALQQLAEQSGERISVDIVPIYNRTRQVFESLPESLQWAEFENIPCIDIEPENINDEKIREEYRIWKESLADEEKANYRKWYENTCIKTMKEHGLDINNIPREGWNVDIWILFLDRGDLKHNLEKIPKPATLKEKEMFEQVLVHAINKLPLIIDGISQGSYKRDYHDTDLLSVIPEECITDRLVFEAIKKDARYLDYADLESKEAEGLLQVGYKSKLETLGRTELTKQEMDLMKKWSKNNATLFSTLNLSLLKPDIVGCIGEDNLEIIARYPYTQSWIIELAKEPQALTVLSFALENLKEGNEFIGPLIEKLSISIVQEEHIVDSTHEVIREPGAFLKLASSRINDKTRELSDEEKTIISYLALNPEEAKKIKGYDDILHFVTKKNLELDEIMDNPQSTLIEVKNAYIERAIGISYRSAVDLVRTYGNDPEELFKQYQSKGALGTFKEMAEKEALEIVIKLKSLIETNDLSEIQKAYQEVASKEDKTTAFQRYKQAPLLEDTLRRAYGRDMVQALDSTDREDNIQSIEHTDDGQEYMVRKVNGQFNRIVSLMNAYRGSEAEGDMYDRWNTTEMARNHALCYSFIDQTNPGTAAINGKKGIIISIKDFSEQAVMAMAPYDLCSDFSEISTYTGRPQKFYMAKNLQNQTRGQYSEVNVEIKDVSAETTDYRKIQPASIICFEEIDDESINAAIELSKKLGRTIPIELIDRRELASKQKEEITDLFVKFKKGEALEPELVGHIITKFNNVRNAHRSSSLSDELLGENPGKERPEAMFNKGHLNSILSQCIEVAVQKINDGGLEEGLRTIEQIKRYIQEEREKFVLMPTMYEKQLMAGIDVNIDYTIDEIQRMYVKRDIITQTRYDSLEISQSMEYLDTTTFDVIYGENVELPKQLTLGELQEIMDFQKLREASEDVHKKGYYMKNDKYDEDHVARVIMFSDTIAALECADEETRKLLIEAAKYYSCGRQLDMEEPHEQYSAKIAGKELQDRYSLDDIHIIQAAIELQNFKPEKQETSDQERKDRIIQLCEKYGISQNQVSRFECMARYITDAVELDKTRFVKKAKYNSPGEEFYHKSLKTEAARKLIRYELWSTR